MYDIKCLLNVRLQQIGIFYIIAWICIRNLTKINKKYMTWSNMWIHGLKDSNHYNKLQLHYLSETTTIGYITAIKIKKFQEGQWNLCFVAAVAMTAIIDDLMWRLPFSPL